MPPNFRQETAVPVEYNDNVTYKERSKYESPVYTDTFTRALP